MKSLAPGLSRVYLAIVLLVILAAAGAGWLVYSRHRDNRRPAGHGQTGICNCPMVPANTKPADYSKYCACN